MDLTLRIALRKWCELLQQHSGRDKVVRVTGYICTLISDFPGVRDGPLGPKFRTIGKQLSLTRSTMRLFDDLSMLNSTLSYGVGSSETDTIKRLSMLLSNAINTLYYPMEHIAWASDQGVIALPSSPFWKIVSYCWASTTYLGIVRTVRTISQLIQHRRHLVKQDGRPSEVDAAKYREGMVRELLTLTQQCADFGIAINSIQGLLWGGKLKPRHTAFLGIISSIVALAKLLKLAP